MMKILFSLLAGVFLFSFAVPAYADLPAIEPKALLELKIDIDQKSLPPGVTLIYEYAPATFNYGSKSNAKGYTFHNTSGVPFYTLIPSKETLGCSNSVPGLPSEYCAIQKFAGGEVEQYHEGLIHLEYGMLIRMGVKFPASSAWYGYFGFDSTSDPEYRKLLHTKQRIDILAYHNNEVRKIPATITYVPPRYKIDAYKQSALFGAIGTGAIAALGGIIYLVVFWVKRRK